MESNRKRRLKNRTKRFNQDFVTQKKGDTKNLFSFLFCSQTRREKEDDNVFLEIENDARVRNMVKKSNNFSFCRKK